MPENGVDGVVVVDPQQQKHVLRQKLSPTFSLLNGEEKKVKVGPSRFRLVDDHSGGGLGRHLRKEENDERFTLLFYVIYFNQYKCGKLNLWLLYDG